MTRVEVKPVVIDDVVSRHRVEVEAPGEGGCRTYDGVTLGV